MTAGKAGVRNRRGNAQEWLGKHMLQHQRRNARSGEQHNDRACVVGPPSRQRDHHRHRCQADGPGRIAQRHDEPRGAAMLLVQEREVVEGEKHLVVGPLDESDVEGGEPQETQPSLRTRRRTRAPISRELA